VSAQALEGRRTPLYARHEEMGARMIVFGGWVMPVEYSGIIAEHLAVREKAGLFDLSHMGELVTTGPVEAQGQFLDWALTRRVSHLAPGQIAYSPMCRHDGGIVDDVVVYRRADDFMLVVNAANTDKDREWLAELADRWSGSGRPAVGIEDISERTALLAVQGPAAQAILQPHVPDDLAPLRSFQSLVTRVAGREALVSRTGYTGEDGFELYVAPDDAVPLWDLLLETGGPQGLVPVGLGARDTLRLEARLLLYGNDIDETTNPLEAGLKWTVDFDKDDFVGRDALMRVASEGVRRRLVGFEMIDRGIPRNGYPIVAEAALADGAGDDDRAPIGHVTSGTHSPSLDRPIGLGYVAVEHASAGTVLGIDVRGRLRRARVVKGRFIAPGR